MKKTINWIFKALRTIISVIFQIPAVVLIAIGILLYGLGMFINDPTVTFINDPTVTKTIIQTAINSFIKK